MWSVGGVCPQRGRGLSPAAHDGDGAEVAEESVLEDTMTEERIDTDGIGLVAKADEHPEAHEI